ncbi:MAG: nucleotidyltransferase family protein [Chloroflexi bacterium]|nr:nucleotidyltransferase family protein [Chloroflexota bacterium]
MNISAIILAAGQSKRMGQPKMLLPWGNTTVLGKVIETIENAGIEDILVITGGARDAVEKLITNYQLRIIHNQDYANSEMLESIQLGLQGQKPEAQATLICLGDQPQVEERSVRIVCEMFLAKKSSIVVPSYQMRRGHPWLIARELWGEVLQMRAPESMREFLNKHGDEIFYIEIESPNILQDLDTPEDYLKYKPQRAIVKLRKEVAMSDLTLIAEDILNAMQAVEDAHKAAEELRAKTDHAAFDAFRAKMLELQDHLSKLKMVLDNEEAFAMDELMDAMSKVYSGHRADYRRTPRMNE